MNTNVAETIDFKIGSLVVDSQTHESGRVVRIGLDTISLVYADSLYGFVHTRMAEYFDLILTEKQILEEQSKKGT